MPFIINTNAWNKIRYTVYSPVYNFVGKFFSTYRKLSIEALQIKPGDKVLLVGAGTGLDLDFINRGAEIIATDITPSMVQLARKRAARLKLNARVEEMDGHQLSFDDHTFDKVILHLIVAVIPDPVKCLKEAERVLKPGGQVAVFDKFLPDGKKLSFSRRLINSVANTFFSNINRSFADILQHTRLVVISDKPATFSGNFRMIHLQKKPA